MLLLAGAPTWLLIAVGVGLALTMLTFLGAYIYLLIKLPDALRSESYSLSKMAIEKGLVGDNLLGLSDPRKGSPALQNSAVKDVADEVQQ